MLFLPQAKFYLADLAPRLEHYRNGSFDFLSLLATCLSRPLGRHAPPAFTEFPIPTPPPTDSTSFDGPLRWCCGVPDCLLELTQPCSSWGLIFSTWNLLPAFSPQIFSFPLKIEGAVHIVRSQGQLPRF